MTEDQGHSQAVEERRRCGCRKVGRRILPAQSTTAWNQMVRTFEDVGR